MYDNPLANLKPPLRYIKLVARPNGMLKRHKSGTPLPDGWIILKDESLFCFGKLLDIFNNIPMINEADFEKEE